MKKVYFTLLFIGSFSVIFSQVTLTLEQYNALNSKIDSLQNGWHQAANMEEVLSKQLDSLSNLTEQVLREKDKALVERDSLWATLNLIEKENNNFIQNLNVNKTTIEELKTKLKTKEQEITALKKQKIESEEKHFKQGRQDALNIVTNSYSSLSFDEMILASSEKQVARDIELISDKDLKQKLSNLEKYFTAKQVLSQRFNQQNVQAALEKAKNLKESIHEDSKLVNALVDHLDNYELRSNGLKSAIEKINTIDKEVFIANTEKDEKEKEKDYILPELSWYFYNYEFTYEDYPYLSSIIIDIMKIKHRDANTDISDFLNKL